MKRLAGSDSDSMGALMSICPNSTDEGNNPMDFQTMMDGYDEDNCMDQESCQLSGSEKKRRLSVDQVKALEKNFEVENKLEPERKLKLAQELGLQPRQVAVWFQNRRARWKTKQLERDYGVLKANYDALSLDFEKLQRDNQALLKEIRDLKSKAANEEGGNRKKFDSTAAATTGLTSDSELGRSKGVAEEAAAAVIKVKDPSLSDSCDSSAILNEDVSLNVNDNDFQFQDTKVANVDHRHEQQQHQHQQFVKIEEHNFFGEESCSTLFSDDQAPTLHWYEWS